MNRNSCRPFLSHFIIYLLSHVKAVTVNRKQEQGKKHLSSPWNKNISCIFQTTNHKLVIKNDVSYQDTMLSTVVQKPLSFIFYLSCLRCVRFCHFLETYIYSQS
jgi:hypothetical protein